MSPTERGMVANPLLKAGGISRGHRGRGEAEDAGFLPTEKAAFFGAVILKNSEDGISLMTSRGLRRKKWGCSCSLFSILYFSFPPDFSLKCQETLEKRHL